MSTRQLAPCPHGNYPPVHMAITEGQKLTGFASQSIFNIITTFLIIKLIMAQKPSGLSPTLTGRADKGIMVVNMAA